MFLLSNRKINYIIFTLLILILQINFPSIIFFNNYKINLDLMLVYFTFLVLLNGSYKLIFYAFLYGLIQDMVISVDQLGLLSFITSFTVFLLLSIRDYDNLWSLKIKYFSIFLIYLFHFLFYYLILYSDLLGVIFLISFFQAFVSFMLFFSIANFFIKIK